MGGIAVGTIVTFQTGAPFRLSGGYNTFNDYGDGGVDLHGISSCDLQKAVGVHRVAGKSYANLIDPTYLKTGGRANPTYITPNTTPGTFGNIIYLYRPHAFYQDMSAVEDGSASRTVQVPPAGRIPQCLDHPVFGSTPGSFNGGIQSSGFGRGGVTNTLNGFGRIIELRGNFEF